MYVLGGKGIGFVIKYAHSTTVQWFTTVGLSLARVTSKTSQVVFVGGQVVFLQESPVFYPTK